MRLPEQPGEGKPEHEEKWGRGAPGGGEEPPRSQAPDFPTWQVFSPLNPLEKRAFLRVCSGLIVFCPQVGGGVGLGVFAAEWGGGGERGDLQTGHLRGVQRRHMSKLGTERKS